MGVQIGDMVTVTRRDVGDGWWEGELNGVYGLFPEKYVKLVHQSQMCALVCDLCAD